MAANDHVAAVQARGDAQVSNFGIFGSAGRRLIADVEDFDETLPGAWEWDVRRLAASLEVAARDNGFPGVLRCAIVMAAAARRRQAMRACVLALVLAGSGVGCLR